MSLEVETESMQSGNLGLKIILTEAKSILIGSYIYCCQMATLQSGTLPALLIV